MKVFISSTYDDLREYRRAVRDAILRLGHHPIGMEDFGSRPDTPKKAALDAVGDCDAFVGIYAHRYGSIPDGDSLSLIEQEFDRASGAGKPCYVYLIDPTFNWQGARDDGAKAELLRRLMAKVNTLLRSQFTTPDDLAAKVAADLGRDFPRHSSVKTTPTFAQEQFELARQLLRLVTRYKAAFDSARAYLVFENEIASRPRAMNELSEEGYLLGEQYARLNRIRPIRETLDELFKLIPEAEEILQPNIAQFIAPLSREIVLLFDSIYYYYPEELARVRGEIENVRNPERHEQFLRALRAPHPRSTYYGEVDEVGERVSEHIQRIREVLRKYLRARN